ncbi:MAG: RNA polymerase sigma factor [Bacteroidia bacterium]
MISEKDLIAECIDGNRKYQEILYRKFADKMYNVSLTYTDDQDEACDILQEGFIKVFRNLHTFHFEGSFEGWIRKIIVNTALEFYRKKKREKEFLEEYENTIIPNIDNIIEKINAEDVIKLVNQLPSKAAMVLKLFAIEGYNHKEISEIMEISEGTSKSQLNRARFLFKEAMIKQNG